MVTAVDLAGIRAVYGGLAIQLSGAVVLVTPAQQWAYAAELPLDLSGIEDTGSAIRIQIAVPRGTVGIGWLRQDEKDWVCQTAASSLVGQEIELVVPMGTIGGKLVFSNWTERGKAAVGIVESIQIEAIKDSDREVSLAKQQGAG